MRAQQLPQVVLAKLVDMDTRLAELMADAQQAQHEVESARDIVNGKNNDVTAEQYERARAGFNELYAAAKTAKERAEVQHKVLVGAKAWVEALSPDTKLLLVQPAASDLSLADLRARLAGLREELRALSGSPPAASDIGQRVDAHVAELAAKAPPLVRNFHGGGALDVRWPAVSDANRRSGAGFAPDHGNALLLMAAMFPRELSGLIVQAITDQQPLSQAEHNERRNELEHAIDEMSYAVAVLLEQAGEPPDDKMAPWHVLGLRVEEHERAVA